MIPTALVSELPTKAVIVFSEAMTALTSGDDEASDRAFDKLWYDCPYQFSDEFGEQVDQFNNGVILSFNLPGIQRKMYCEGSYESETCTYHLSYKDKTIKWQETPDTESDTFEIMQIAKLVYPDIEVRVDVISLGNSDHSFYGLRPNEWQTLEIKFGKDKVQEYFAPVATKFDEAVYGRVILESNSM